MWDKLLLALIEKFPSLILSLWPTIWPKLCDAYCEKVRAKLVEKLEANDPDNEVWWDEGLIMILDVVFGCSGN